MKVKVQAPTRISLFGGGTDLPIFYKENGGAVISMAINLRQHFTLKKLNKNQRALEYEDGDESFYEAFVPLGYLLKTNTDVPIRSGLGSSASAAVALVTALNPELTKQEIVDKAWTIEVEELKLYGGKQDQIAATFGGFNFIEFERDGDGWHKDNHGFVVNPYSRELGDWWSERLVLFFTGKTRTNPRIQEELKTLSDEQIERLINMRNSALEADVLVKEKAIDVFSTLLNEMWEEKKKLNPLVTNSHIDNIYNQALKSGAMAGKLLGSGGGGFMVFLARPENKEKLIQVLETIEGVKHYDYSIDWNGVEVKSQ